MIISIKEKNGINHHILTVIIPEVINVCAFKTPEISFRSNILLN